jgi:hypothetical protein
MIATFSTSSYGWSPLWLQTKILKKKTTIEVGRQPILWIGEARWIGRVFFGRGITSPGQKWWQTLWGRQVACSQIRKPKHALKVPLLFPLLSFGGAGWRRIFFHFPLVPTMHYVPFKFPMGSHQIPNGFPSKFPMCSPSSQYVP